MACATWWRERLGLRQGQTFCSKTTPNYLFAPDSMVKKKENIPTSGCYHLACTLPIYSALPASLSPCLLGDSNEHSTYPPTCALGRPFQLIPPSSLLPVLIPVGCSSPFLLPLTFILSAFSKTPLPWFNFYTHIGMPCSCFYSMLYHHPQFDGRLGRDWTCWFGDRQVDRDRTDIVPFSASHAFPYIYACIIILPAKLYLLCILCLLGH